MIFRQIRSKDDSGTLTYLIADEDSKDAVVIDPNIEDLDRILYMAPGFSVLSYPFRFPLHILVTVSLCIKSQVPNLICK